MDTISNRQPLSPLLDTLASRAITIDGGIKANAILDALNMAFQMDPSGIHLVASNRMVSNIRLMNDHPYFPVSLAPVTGHPVIDGLYLLNMAVYMISGKWITYDFSESPNGQGQYTLRGFKLVEPATASSNE